MKKYIDNVIDLSITENDRCKKMPTEALAENLVTACINMQIVDKNYYLVREAATRLRDFDKALRELKYFYDDDKTAYMTPAYAAALAFADNLLEEWKND